MTQQIVVRQIYRWCPIAVLLLVVGLVGVRLGSETHAEVRKNAPRAAFQSGSERSEQILREISQTLKSIDGRLQRLEKVATMPQP
jgi:hypothetical protein